jgi:hypothetical protein
LAVRHDTGVSFEGRLDRTAEHTASLSVHDADLAQAEPHALVQVLGHERAHISRLERVEIELVADRHMDDLFAVAVAVVAGAAGLFIIGRHQPEGRRGAGAALHWLAPLPQLPARFRRSALTDV